MNLVVVGSVALDSVKTPYGEVENALGGSAVYASMVSKNFCKTHIVGVIGNDFPEEHINLLQKNDICCKGLEIKPGKTFFWKGVYDNFNEAKTLDTQLNVFANFEPRLPSDYRKYKYLLLGNIDPALQLNVLKQMENTRITACDTMNFWISGKRSELLEVISRVDILFINEDEIKMLTNQQNIFKAAEIVESYGPRLIVIKRGEYGAMSKSKDFIFFAPIYPVREVVDPTGAGDCFAGGFMGYIAFQNKFNNDTIKKALIYGTIAASFCIESFSLEKLREINIKMIESRMEELRESVIF